MHHFWCGMNWIKGYYMIVKVKKWNLLIFTLFNGNAFLNIVILYYLLLRRDVWFENHLVCNKTWLIVKELQNNCAVVDQELETFSVLLPSNSCHASLGLSVCFKVECPVVKTQVSGYEFSDCHRATWYNLSRATSSGGGSWQAILDNTRIRNT